MLQRMFQVFGVIGVVFVTGLFASMSQAQDDPIAVGESLAKTGVGAVPACSSCHGALGEGTPAAGFPALAGMNALYLERQLLDMKAGKREVNPAMKPVIDGLTEPQIRAASAYYATLEKPGPVAATGDIERGKWLVERGNWDQGVPACAQCHGPNAGGLNELFPSLAGQSALYITNQIAAWKKGTRTNDANGLMGSVAKRISDADAAAAAAYLQQIGGQP